MDNISADGELYKQLKTSYGEDFANRVMNDGKYITAMQDIKNAAIEKMKNGEYNTNGAFDSTKLVADLAKQLGSNIKSFYPNGLGDLELDDLNTLYGSFVKAASQETDSQAELQKRRDAAIMYCDALYSKSTYKSAVTDVFGKDYKKAINKMLPSEIETKIAELQEKATEVVGTSNVSIKDWSGFPNENNELAAGETVNFRMSAQLNNDSNVKLTYKMTSISGATGTCSELGAINFKAQDTEGYVTMTIAVYANDGTEPIGTKTLTYKVKETNANVISKTTDSRLALGSVDNWNSETNFRDLYDNDKNVILYGKMDAKKHDWDRMKDTIKNNLTTLGTQIVDILATAGLDKTKLTTAMNNVVKRYYDAGAIKNNDNRGKKQSNLTNNCNEYMANNRTATASRITWTVDTDGKDSNVYMIHFKDFVDDILKEYGV